MLKQIFQKYGLDVTDGSFVPIFQDIGYRDNSKYNELIYDLRQLKIFSK